MLDFERLRDEWIPDCDAKYLLTLKKFSQGNRMRKKNRHRQLEPDVLSINYI